MEEDLDFMENEDVKISIEDMERGRLKENNICAPKIKK